MGFPARYPIGSPASGGRNILQAFAAGSTFYPAAQPIARFNVDANSVTGSVADSIWPSRDFSYALLHSVIIESGTTAQGGSQTIVLHEVTSPTASAPRLVFLPDVAGSDLPLVWEYNPGLRFNGGIGLAVVLSDWLVSVTYSVV